MWAEERKRERNTKLGENIAERGKSRKGTMTEDQKGGKVSVLIRNLT